MAITLNKQAIRCEEIALAGGKITAASSPHVLLYDISRSWRKVLESKKEPADDGKWSKREEAAADVLIATLTYLQRIGCKNIEHLLMERIAESAREVE